MLGSTIPRKSADAGVPVADDEGQLLLDLKDLRAMLQNVADRSAERLKTLWQCVGPPRWAPSSAACCGFRSQGARTILRRNYVLDVHESAAHRCYRGRGMVNIL